MRSVALGSPWPVTGSEHCPQRRSLWSGHLLSCSLSGPLFRRQCWFGPVQRWLCPLQTFQRFKEKHVPGAFSGAAAPTLFCKWMTPFMSFFSSPLNCLTAVQYTDFLRLIEFFKTLKLCRSSENSVNILLFIYFSLIIKSSTNARVC